jgi:hypothetical protein
MLIMRTLDVSKNVTTRVYVSKSKGGPRAKKILGNWSNRLRRRKWPCHRRRPSHAGGPGSIPGKFMRKLWWTKLHLDRFSSEHVGFPLPVRAQWPAPKSLNDDTASVMYYNCLFIAARITGRWLPRDSITGGRPIINT